MLNFANMSLAVVLAGAIWATIADVRHRIIPNLACVVVAAFGVVWLLTTQGHPWSWLSIAAAVFVLAVGTWMHDLKVIGGGDVKLCAAIVVWLPPSLLASFVFYGAIGSILTSLTIRVLQWRKPGSNAEVPMALALLAGLVSVVPGLLTGR